MLWLGTRKTLALEACCSRGKVGRPACRARQESGLGKISSTANSMAHCICALPIDKIVFVEVRSSNRPSRLPVRPSRF